MENNRTVEPDNRNSSVPAQQPTALDKKRAAVAANANNIRNAADVAIASGHPVAVGIGEGVKIADKICSLWKGLP